MQPFGSKKNSQQAQQQAKQYNDYVMNKMPKSSLVADCAKAFLIGGLICVIGQIIMELIQANFDLDKNAVSGLTSVIMVIIGATLTGIGIYDKIGKFAGAGSVVPITGFANSIVSPAMEHKREGIILGIGANLFKLAGPVLVNGITASVIYGLICLVF